MIPNHPQFLGAIAERMKVRLRFYSLPDSGILDRTCAPLDYGPGTDTADGLNRYWLWDDKSPAGTPPLGLVPGQIVDLQVLGEPFNPADFPFTPWPWAVPRNWGSPA